MFILKMIEQNRRGARRWLAGHNIVHGKKKGFIYL